MTKELKEALHKVLDACIDFKAHGVDMFFEYAPHYDNCSPFGSYTVDYYSNGAWGAWPHCKHIYIDQVTHIGVDELTNTLEYLKKLAVKFAFTLEVDE